MLHERAWPCDLASSGHAVDGRHRPRPRAAGTRTADAEPRDLAARDDRRAAHGARAAESQYPLAAILDACRRFPLKKRSRITFEYVHARRVNDTPDDARRLVKLLSGIKSKVNLIPLNPAPGIPLRSAVGRARRSLRADPGRSPHHRVGAKEPRPRHPRGVRPADRRRADAKRSAAQQMATASRV